MANGRPYGNDFIVGTPALDQIHNQLYADHKNREIQRQHEMTSLDDEFSRNVAGIKDADVDDLTKLYGDYKTASQQLMKQRDGATPQQQLELLRKKAEMYKLINISKQEKENAAILGKAVMNDTKGIYDDKAAQRVKARLKTPTLQYGKYTEVDANGKPIPIDLTDETSYLYKLGGSDFSKDFEAAKGKDRDLTPDDKVVDPQDPLKFSQKQYKGKNNAIEFYTTLLPRISGSKEQKDFVLRTDIDYPAQKAAELEARYKELVKEPAYRRKYGLKEGDEIPLTSYDSPVARAVRIRAMEHAVNSPIIEKVDKTIDNKAAVMDRTEKFKIDQQERSHQNAQSNIRLAYGFRAIEGEKLEETSDRAIERDKDYAKTHNGNLDMPPAKMKLLFGETGGTATINSNGDYVRKHGDKEDVLPASEAKTKLMVQGKPGYVPGVKGATNSKPTTGGTHKVVIKKGELD